MTSDAIQPITREDLRTPRAAAWAGILFALLVGAIILLTLLSIPPGPPYEIGRLTELPDTSR